MIIKVIQESCVHLFQKTHLVSCWIFDKKNLETFNSDFFILKYDLLIKTLNH